MGPAPLSKVFSHSLCYPQSNWAPLVLVPEWVGLCTLQAPVGLSRTSPVRLGFPPAAAPTPMGPFNQRFEALFPRVGALGCAVCFTSRRLSGLCVRECGVTGSASGRTACPFIPHSASLGPARATRVLSALVPISAPPTGLDECLFFISLVSDFLAVQFSVSSGCVRRRSVSAYAAILVLPIL